METNNDQVHCPKCGSTSLSTNKKGFSGKKAVAGAILTGGIGILVGTIGSNKIVITCLNCGKQFKPGQGSNTAAPGDAKLIWNEEQKKHVLNPNRKTPVNTGPLIFCVLAFIFLIIVICATQCGK